MKLTIDRDADALYLNLDETLAEESRGFSLGVILDYNAGGKVVGIEMLHLSKRSDHLNLKAPVRPAESGLSCPQIGLSTEMAVLTLKARSGSVGAWFSPLPASNSGPLPGGLKSDQNDKKSGEKFHDG